MSALQTLVRRALFAALTLLPLPALAEVAARFDAASGHVSVTGLSPQTIETTLAEQDRLQLRVTVQAPRHGMLVALTQEGDTLVIAPRFSLRPGTGYTVTLDMPDERFEAALTLAAPDTPVPQIIGFAPSQAVIPANTLRMYLRFSQPMARGQLRRAVTLKRADGTEVPSPFLTLDAELWDPTQTRATLLLDPGRIKQGVGPNAAAGAPLVSGERYQLVVAGTMHSAAGKALGPDATLAFRAGPPERRPITPEAWQILAPEAGSRAPLTVAFDRIMDSGAALRLLSLQDATGAPVAGSIATDGGGWSFSPERPWQPGRHTLVIDPELEDVSGNTIAAPFDAAPGTIGTATRPATRTLEIAVRRTGQRRMTRMTQAARVTSADGPLGLRTDPMPPDMQRLLDAYPRDTWEAHPGFQEKTRNWLGAHRIFRTLAAMVRTDTEEFLDRRMDAPTYCDRLWHLGGRLVGKPHGHYGWEDHSYFPELSAADPRFDAGLAILEQDHETMNNVLDAFTRSVDRANNLTRLEEAQARNDAGRLHAQTIEAFLNRHLADEKELAVPIILHHRLRG